MDKKLEVIAIAAIPDTGEYNFIAWDADRTGPDGYIANCHVPARVCNAVQNIADTVGNQRIITVTYFKDGMMNITYHIWKLDPDSNAVNRLWEIIDHLYDHLNEPMAQLPEGEVDNAS